MTVRNNTLKIFEVGIKNNINIDSAAKEPGLRQEPKSNSYSCPTTNGLPLAQPSKTNNEDHAPFVVDRIVMHATEKGKTKYVVRWYRYHLEEAGTETPHHLSEHFVVP